MTDKGYFVITDICGYTEYLVLSELDHANEILQYLFNAQIEAIKPPFVISDFHGDAIFIYIPETNFIAPQSMLEALENLYFVFADTLQQMQSNLICTSRACRNMPKLGLKMVIDYGEYVLQKIGDRERLLGADVIVPHRMLKNQVTEETGIACYALFSEAVAQRLKLSELADPLTPYSESYEHIGEVKMQVLDLHQIWQREQKKNIA